MAIKPKKVPAVKKPTIDDVYGGAPAAEPEASPAPIAEAAPEPEPAPVSEPVPEPVTTEETMPAPTTTPPEPTEPEPAAAQAAPEPAPEPAPVPAAPAPTAAEPEPPPVVEPVVEAAAPPAPEPVPEPAPEPEPVKAAEPDVIPEPAPVAAPVVEPVAAVAAAAPAVAVAVPTAPPPAPRRRPVLYAVTAFSLLLSAATTAAVATLPLWRGELDRVWERVDPAAASTFVIAAQGVARAAAGSAPFTGAVDVARALAPAGQAPIAAALDRVAAFADKGAPAMPALRARFETVAVAIRDSAAPRSANPGLAPGWAPGWAPAWVERSVNELSTALPVGGLMNTDLFGAPAPAPNPPALRNAEMLLTAGNLREAVASVRSLGPAPVALASAWLSDAQRRIDLDDAARTLERLALEHHQAALAEPSLEERLNRMVKAVEDRLFE